MSAGERALEIGGGLALLAVAGYEYSKNTGVKITGVAYAKGPGSSQGTAAVTVVNHDYTASAYTLVGYQTEQALLNAAVGKFGILDSAITKFNKVAALKSYGGKSYPAGLITGHWYSQANIQASGTGAANPTLAGQERAIGFTCPRGQSTKVMAYTATPFSDLVSAGTEGLVNFWFVFSGTNTLSGKPVASWLDSKPSMPAI